jgi:hypothetical protein
MLTAVTSKHHCNSIQRLGEHRIAGATGEDFAVALIVGVVTEMTSRHAMQENDWHDICSTKNRPSLEE